MAAYECLRDYVNQRLSAAAEEIFGVFKKTIVEYEEVIDQQRRLLDKVWKPDINPHKEVPQEYVHREEEGLTDQQLCNLQRSSSLHQEDPEPPQIKEEQEEPGTSHDGDTLIVKLEDDTFMMPPTYEKSEPEVENGHQLSYDHSHVAEDQYSGPSGSAEPQNQHHNMSYFNTEPSLSLPVNQRNTQTAKKSFHCDTCGKDFKCKAALQRHIRTHTGDRPYACIICGKRFYRLAHVERHTRIHTGEKPYTCNICGKSFCQESTLITHRRIHTGEKPYSCQICGKGFRHSGAVLVHMRIHTGDRPYLCNICGKGFCNKQELKRHMRIHTGERPYTCKICGKGFRVSGHLNVHMKRAHTVDKPLGVQDVWQRMPEEKAPEDQYMQGNLLSFPVGKCSPNDVAIATSMDGII